MSATNATRELSKYLNDALSEGMEKMGEMYKQKAGKPALAQADKPAEKVKNEPDPFKRGVVV